MLVDSTGKEFTATPYRPTKIGSRSERPFKQPLYAPADASTAYYLVSRTTSMIVDPVETSSELGDSFLMTDLFSEVSAQSKSPKSMKSARSSKSKYKKFKPLYTKLKVKKKQWDFYMKFYLKMKSRSNEIFMKV